MARSLNQVTIMGNLTRDPELRDMPNGSKVVSFSLALNRAYKNGDGEWVEATDFIDVVAYAQLAERVATYLFKGRRALIQGRLQSRSWEQDGVKKTKVEVIANDVTFIDKHEEVVTDSKSGYEKFKQQGQEIKSRQVDTVHDVPEDDEVDLSSIPF